MQQESLISTQGAGLEVGFLEESTTVQLLPRAQAHPPPSHQLKSYMLPVKSRLVPSKERRDREEREERNKALPYKTRNYKFRFFGEQKFRFLDPTLEKEGGIENFDRHASQREAVAEIESKDADTRVLEKHRRQVDLLLAELKRVDEVINYSGRKDLLPSQVLKSVERRKNKRDRTKQKGREWRQRKGMHTRNGSKSAGSGSATTEDAASACPNAQDYEAAYRPSRLSQVLEVPSTDASADNEHPVKPSDLLRTSISSGDSFDIRLEPEEGEEDEEAEKDSTPQQPKPPQRSRGLTATTAMANAYDAGQSTRTSIRNAGIHMRFTEKRHWYVDGPAVYINLDACDIPNEDADGQSTATRRRIKHRHHTSKVNEGSVMTAYERWLQRHPETVRSEDEDSSSSSDYTDSSGDEGEEETTDEVLHALRGDESERSTSKGGGGHAPESEDSTENHTTQISAQHFLQAVPRLDQEALEEIQIGLRNVHMYYRNFSGDLNAKDARGVQQDISPSPRDWEWASPSGTRPGTTSSNTGSRPGTSGARVRALCGAGGSQDDLILPLGRHPTPDNQAKTRSAPVTARAEEDEDEGEDEKGGHAWKEDEEQDVSFMSERARADRDIALTLRALRGKTGVTLANSNFIHDAVTKQEKEKEESIKPAAECSWMIRPEKKRLDAPTPSDSRQGTTGGTRAPSAPSCARPSRSRPSHPAPRTTSSNTTAISANNALVTSVEPTVTVKKVRAPQVLRAVLEEEERVAAAETNSASRQEVASTAAHVAEGMKEENLAYGRFRFKAPPDPTDKRFESKARSVRAEMVKLPIFKEFVRYSMCGDGKRWPLMAHK